MIEVLRRGQGFRHRRQGSSPFLPVVRVMVGIVPLDHPGVPVAEDLGDPPERDAFVRQDRCEPDEGSEIPLRAALAACRVCSNLLADDQPSPRR